MSKIKQRVVIDPDFYQSDLTNNGGTSMWIIVKVLRAASYATAHGQSSLDRNDLWKYAGMLYEDINTACAWGLMEIDFTTQPGEEDKFKITSPNNVFYVEDSK